MSESESESDSVSKPAPSANPRPRPWRDALFVAALALALNLAGNGRTSLWDRDEPRFAGCAREMRDRGDWLLPTFNGEPRFHKPILIYWVMRAGFLVAGDNPFGARLGSAVAGAATCLLVLALGRRLLGARPGFLAALMYATAPIVVAESKLATTDATLALLVVASQFCLWELARRDSRRLAATFWVLSALATLTKGPVGPALIAAAGLASWWCGGPTAAWTRLRWRWGLPLFLAVAAPWFVAVGWASHGEFFRYSLGKQMADRVVSDVEQHGGFPGFYVVTAALTFHPWSALLPAAYLGAWARRRTDPSLGFLLGWAVGPLLLLECVRTKLVHYYLPALPACALLVAWLVDALGRDGVNLRRWPLGRFSLNLLGGIGIGFGVVLAAAAVVLPRPLTAPCLVASAVVTAGTLLGLFRLQGGATDRAVGGLAAAWGLTMLLVGGWLLPAAEPYRLPRLVAEKLARHAADQGAPLVLLTFQEPSMVYTIGRPAPTIRRWTDFYAEVDRRGAVVAAIVHPLDTAEFDKRPDLRVDVLEVVEGFNLTKGGNQRLHLAVIRRNTDPGLDARLARAADPDALVR